MKRSEDVLREAMALHQQSIDEVDEDKLNKAQEMYLGLLNDHPESGQVIFTLATTYLQQGLSGLAINLLYRAAQFNPTAPEVWNNLGSAYKTEQNDAMAERYYRHALSLREHPDYYNNLATLHVNRGAPEQGIEIAKKALSLNPTLAKAAWNLALLELETGDWENGYRHYLAGLDSKDRFLKQYHKADGTEIPYWKGEKDKHVVVYGEQGLGDEIMFASALEDLAKDCKTVVFDCHPRLINIFKRSFSHIENIVAYYPDRKKESAKWELEHDIDYALPIGNLMYHYRRDGNYPRKTYLKPDPEKVKMYREYLESLGPGPYVGLGWVGGYKKTHANVRCTKLGHLVPVMEQGGTFVSLQYTDVKDKVERFHNDYPDITLWHDQKLLQEFDYDETMALVGALDLVICINTTMVHLCGAMGKECWTLTPYERAWRYSRYPQEKMYQYDDCVSLINKDKGQDWHDFVVASVKERYKSWLEKYEV